MKINFSCQTIEMKKRHKSPLLLSTITQRPPAYYLNILKNKKIISNNIMSSRNEFRKQNYPFNTKKLKLNNLSDKTRNKKKKILPKIYSYKFFHKDLNKYQLHKSCNDGYSIDKERNNMESNFMQLCGESNIYTFDVKYISNKKMILMNKYIYDKNIYKPDRLKLHDITEIKGPKLKIKKINLRNIFTKRHLYNKNQIETAKYKSNLNHNLSNLYL